MDDFRQAVALFGQGDLLQALRLASQYHAQHPEHVETLLLLAEIQARNSDSPSAIGYLQAALTLQPAQPAAWRRLGQMQVDNADWVEAQRSFQEAIRHAPSHPRAYNNLGNVQEKLGQPQAAMESYRQAIACDPKYALAYQNLGAVCLSVREFEAARHSFQQLVSINPDHTEGWAWLSEAWRCLKRWELAITAARRAVEINPDSDYAWFALCQALYGAGRLTESLSASVRALQIKPDHAAVLILQASIYLSQGEVDLARVRYELAYQIDPSLEDARLGAVMATIPNLALDIREVETSRVAFHEALERLADELQAQPCQNPELLVGSFQPFYLAYQEQNNRELMSFYGDICVQALASWPMPAAIAAQPRPQNRESRMRIGIVSAHVADHSVYLAIVRGWLLQLDRTKFSIEIFDLGVHEDHFTEEAKLQAEFYIRDLPDLTAWVKVIRARDVDVLLYPELGMHRLTFQLASLRLAPQQWTSWGHPMTSGLPTIDAFLSATRFESASSISHYRERLICLPNLGTYLKPTAPTTPLLPKAARADERPLLICPGTPFKYSPQADQVLVAIARDLGACQFCFFNYKDGSLSQRLRTRLESAFKSAGLQANDYLVFRPWAPASEFHALMAQSDVMLDTLGFSGFNTALQALESGLPVIGYRGEFMRGRLASGLLEQLGMSDWVADTAAHYVKLVATAITQPNYTESARVRIFKALPSIYGDVEPIRALEQALLESRS